jgi:aryl-alcohol dehydrogenase-like predicted oxidoreductase
VPLEEQVGELANLQQEGKIRHIGLSEIDVSQLEDAQKTAKIVSVQNLFNLTNRAAEPLLDHCTENNIGFIPWFPLATGKLLEEGGPLSQIAADTGAEPSQLALAWLLKRSPVMLPIPGTSSVAHLDQNLGAGELELTDDQFTALEGVV